MSSVFEFNSGQVTYTTVGNTASTASAVPIALTSPSELATNNMIVFPGGGYISLAEYDALVANATSSPRPSFSLEVYAEFKGSFSLTTYPGINTQDLLFVVSMGRFGTFRIPLYCYSASVSEALFNASAIVCFDQYDDTLPEDPTAFVYNNTGTFIPVYKGLMSFRINYRSQ